MGPMKCKKDHKGYEGCVKEYGPTKIQLKKRVSLFEGLGKTIIVHENHYECAKTVPENMEVLASTEMCPVQAVRVKGKDVFGVQFHPERFEPEYADGKRILKNFLDLVLNR